MKKRLIVILNNQVKEHTTRIKILPESVKWKDLDELPITINNIPIGIEADTLNTSYFDFTKNTINLINSSELDLSTQFTKVLIRKLSTLDNLITLVSDNKKYFDNIASNDFNTINNMIFNSNRRKPMLIFVTGIEKFIESIPKEIKNNYFNRVQELHNCYFIVTEKIDLMKSYLVETWYKTYTNTSNSIFIGKGLNNSLIHTNISTPLRQISLPIPDNYAYNIKNNDAIKIKIVEGE